MSYENGGVKLLCVVTRPIAPIVMRLVDTLYTDHVTNSLHIYCHVTEHLLKNYITLITPQGKENSYMNYIGSVTRGK